VAENSILFLMQYLISIDIFMSKLFFIVTLFSAKTEKITGAKSSENRIVFRAARFLILSRVIEQRIASKHVPAKRASGTK